jgi:UDP-2-acetamido-3-amino-2,3-dideoxy-glucuronate N-acetyltransferase
MSGGVPRAPRPSDMAATQVHTHALVESDDIGEGTVIYAFVHVMPGASIGRDCRLCDHVFVDSGARIGDRVTIKNGVSVWDHVHIGNDVFVGPNVVLTNDLHPRRGAAWQPTPTWIEDGATIGANATIVCGVRLGARSFVGAGAVVVKDVEPHALVVGNPASRLGWVCHCGHRLDSEPSTTCAHCGRRFTISASGPEECA